MKKRATSPVRSVRLDPEVDAAFVSFCAEKGWSASEGLRVLTLAALQATGRLKAFTAALLAEREGQRKAAVEARLAITGAMQKLWRPMLAHLGDEQG